MSVTRVTAVAEIRDIFDTAWNAATSSAPVHYQNASASSAPPSTSVGVWARLSITHQEGFHATVGNRRFRRTGLVTAQVFTTPGTGITGSPDLGTIVRDAFEGVTSTSGVIFRRVSPPQEIGRSGAWFQTNVVAAFEYDEVK